MKMRWPFSLTMIPAFLCCGLFCFAQDINFEKVVPPTDDEEFSVQHMVQDARGYLWLATTTGLYKYDGHTYTAYHREVMNVNSPAANKVGFVMADKDDIIWLSPYGSGLDRLDPTTGIFTHFRHHNKDANSLINDSVWHIIQDHTGMIWLATSGGLEKFNPKTKHFTHYTHNPGDSTSLSYNTVLNVFEDRQQTIWVGTGSPFYLDERRTRGGLNKFNSNSGTFTRYMHKEGDAHSLIDNRVSALFEDSRGNFWVGTAGDGLHTMDRAKGSFERHLYDPTLPHKLSRPALRDDIFYGVDHIPFITEDYTGKIWIGTYEAGINLYDPVTHQTTNYSAEKSGAQKLDDNHFWTTCMTRDHILWFSAYRSGRLYKVQPSRYTLPYTNINKAVICYAEGAAGSLWITTNKGLVQRFSDGGEKRFLFDKDSSSLLNQCYAIFPANGKFWITSNVGLWMFDPLTKTFSNYRHHPDKPGSLVTDSLATLTITNDSILWVGSIHGLDLMDVKTGIFKHYLNNLKDADGTAVEAVFSINTDSKKNHWVGTTRGLYKLDTSTGQYKRYLGKWFVWQVFEDKVGALWATTDGGLFKYDKTTDQFEIFVDELSEITAAPVMWMAEDEQQNLWIASNTKGIIRLNKERTSVTLFGKNQGVHPPALTGYLLIRNNGEILVADTSGYYQFQPALLQRQVTPPAVIINQFLLNNTPITPSATGILSKPLMETTNLRLRYYQNNFSFNFTNIDFSSAHEDTRLLYMLLNYDQAWHKATEEKAAYYFNLPPGKYIFKVKALNAAGMAAEKSIAIIISPPWWKTWWAYSLAVILLAGGAYAIYRNRINQINRKQATQINTMVAAQEGERKRISRDLHDDVGTKLSALKLFLSSLHEKAGDGHNEEIKSLAASSEQFITEVMQDVRQLLLNLSPAVLEEFGYATAVEGLINKINQTKQIQFKLVMFGLKERLQKDYELALYRITQELINNVLKHAEAKNVSLQIGQRDEKIILMIEDDGEGFEVNAHKNGYGLHNLKARTQMMNGTMVIDSTPGKGTSVLIEIPYNFN